jgi:hypothetical protein
MCLLITATLPCSPGDEPVTPPLLFSQRDLPDGPTIHPIDGTPSLNNETVYVPFSHCETVLSSVIEGETEPVFFYLQREATATSPVREPTLPSDLARRTPPDFTTS